MHIELRNRGCHNWGERLAVPTLFDAPCQLDQWCTGCRQSEEELKGKTGMIEFSFWSRSFILSCLSRCSLTYICNKICTPAVIIMCLVILIYE
jgi:hypothetical protein